jgi:hypothetical protein
MLTYMARSSRGEWISRGRRPTLRPRNTSDNLQTDEHSTTAVNQWTKASSRVTSAVRRAGTM